MDGTKKVKVAELRNLTTALLDCVSVHYHACVGDKEKAAWVARTRTCAQALTRAYSPRAKQADLNLKETALDRSADKIFRVMADIDFEEVSTESKLHLLGLQKEQTGLHRWSLSDNNGKQVGPQSLSLGQINAFCDALKARRYGA